MDGLINAILKFSREGRRVLKPEPIKLDALLKSGRGNVQHQVTEAGGAVEIEAKVRQRRIGPPRPETNFQQSAG